MNYENPNWRTLYAEHEWIVDVIVRTRFRAWRRLRDDIPQEGRLLLLLAARRYDPAFGTRFQPYAWDWVTRNLKAFIAESDLIRRPASAVRDARLRGEGPPPPVLGAAAIREVLAPDQVDDADLPVNQPLPPRLAAALAALPPRQREAVERLVINGERPIDVSTEWGRTRCAATGSRHVGLDKLRAALETGRPPAPTIRRLAAAAASLSPRQRAVVERVVLGGEPLGAVAGDLGLSYAAAHARLQRGRARIRRLLSA